MMINGGFDRGRVALELAGLYVLCSMFDLTDVGAGCELHVLRDVDNHRSRDDPERAT